MEEQQLQESQMDTGMEHGNGALPGGDVQNAAGQLDRAPGNIDKIREILFGTNMRDYDARFARLEAAVVKEASDLRESTRKRFESLESFIKSEIESLHGRLRSEREERAEALGQNSRDLRQTEDTLRKKLRDLEDQTSAADSAIREQILNQSQALTEDIRALQAEIMALLERRFHDLNKGKTDRAMLADLLTEVSMRLKNEFQLPVAGN
jgi:DNA repair exonuclease SbcCD ATPase subunit